MEAALQTSYSAHTPFDLLCCLVPCCNFTHKQAFHSSSTY